MSGIDSLLARYLRIAPRSQTENALRLLIRMGALAAGAEEGSLLVLDEEANDLRFAMTIGSEASEAKLLGQRVPVGKGITGLAAACRQVQIGAPTYKDVQQSERQGTGGPEAVIAAPVQIGERLIGVVTAVSFRPGHRFTVETGRLFGGFATIAGVLVDQAQRLANGGQEIATPAPIAGLDPDARIAAAVGRLARAHPRTTPRIVALIASIEALLAAEEEE